MANAQSKVYGASVPSLTYTNATLVNGDTASVFTGNLATTGTANSGVGNYSITQGNLSAGSNYAISYTSANLAVTPYGLTRIFHEKMFNNLLYCIYAFVIIRLTETHLF